MSNHFDIKRADHRDAALMDRIDAWCTKTELHEVKLPRRESVSVFVMWKAEEIAAVYVYYVEPVVSMMFDREAPAMQTVRAFETIRNIMQANGVKPLTFVSHDSPLLEISAKRMRKIEGRDVFRM